MDREFVRVPIDSFIKAYLPFEPTDEVIERIIQHLVPEGPYRPPHENKSYTANSSDIDEKVPLYNTLQSGNSLMLCHKNHLMFHTFPQALTKENGSEKAVYAPLEKIAKKISSLEDLVPGRHRNEYHYCDVSSKTIYSEIDGSNNKIDACFMRGEGHVKPATHDIAVVIEKKLDLGKRGGNNRQAVSANVQIMNDNVRRMFTFRITIELDQQPKLLLKLFTLFMYATPEELGYDPLVNHLGKGRYIFHGISSVHNASEIDAYKSVETISEICANNISGRMSRIFKVVKYNPQSKRFGTKKYVLKDVWLDSNAQTEKQLQDDIFKDIDDFWDNNQTPADLDTIKELHCDLVTSKDYKKHFLSIEGDYVGQQSKLLPDDFQAVRGLLAGPLLDEERLESSSVATRTATHTSKVGHTIPTKTAYHDFAGGDFERTYAPKKHYRVVFNELCTTVGRLNTLGEVFDVLHQTLDLVFCARWVHRDISSGNIMAYRKNLDDKRQPWRVVIADLEYAKKYPPPPDYVASLDPKTGTPFFMPLEIMLKATLFDTDYEDSLASSRVNTVTPSTVATTTTSTVVKKKSTRYETLMAQTSDTNTSLGIIHNFQHDLESIWWLMLWSITSRVTWPPAKEYGYKIFQNTIRASSDRQNAFRKSIEKALRTHLPGELSEHFAKCMDKVRAAMYQDYVNRVHGKKLRDVSSFVCIFKDFRSFFEDVGSSKNKWSLTRLDTPNPFIDPAERKRPPPDDGDSILVDDHNEGEPQSKLLKTTDSDKDMRVTE